jgi:Tfp pilus assembly protein PilF
MTTISEALAQGLAHQQARRWQQAEAIYQQVLAQHPGHAETLNCYAALALEAGQRDQAVAMLEEAVRCEPKNVQVLTNLGSLYVMTGRPQDAEPVLRRALALDPDQPDTNYHLGLVMEQSERRGQAFAFYRRTLELEPGNRAAHVNLGVLLKHQGQYDAALEHFNAALARDPQSRHARYNRGMVHLAQGNFAEGFADYEARLEFPEFGTLRRPEPEWDGRPLEVQSLVIYGEQGIGDMIQFVRYLPLVQARCRNFTLEVPQTMLPLFRASGIGNLALQVAPGRPLPPEAPRYDFQIPLLSLPRVLGTTLETIPGGVPYLKVSEARAAQWRERLRQFAGLKVGIAWQGRPSHRDDRFRSIPLTQFAALAAVDGVRLLSLQKGHGHEQLADLAGRFRVDDLQQLIDPQAEPLLDVAAMLLNLDLLVTCDTSLAHLAGALGVPVWVALPAYGDWRWLLGRTDSPWYPTMRLFRQVEQGVWEPVFAQLAGELRAMTASSASRMEL